MDFWCKCITGRYSIGDDTERTEFYDKYILPMFKDADACIIAGDIANNHIDQMNFLRYIATKHIYRKVYYVMGNHDLTVKENVLCPFATSEERIAFIRNGCADIPNLHFLEGDICDGIAGGMGFSDFKCCESEYATPSLERWFNWYDGALWNYMNQRPKAIRNHYRCMLKRLCKREPKVVVTHYLPIQFGIPFEYRNSSSNAFFYFDGKDYLDMLPDGAVWVAGHTHGARKLEYKNSSGNTIHLLCNPIGYPGENPYADGGFKGNDFIIEV